MKYLFLVASFFFFFFTPHIKFLDVYLFNFWNEMILCVFFFLKKKEMILLLHIFMYHTFQVCYLLSFNYIMAKDRSTSRKVVGTFIYSTQPR